jgi:hypothetical protein
MTKKPRKPEIYDAHVANGHQDGADKALREKWHVEERKKQREKFYKESDKHQETKKPKK